MTHDQMKILFDNKKLILGHFRQAITIFLQTLRVQLHNLALLILLLQDGVSIIEIRQAPEPRWEGSLGTCG